MKQKLLIAACAALASLAAGAQTSGAPSLQVRGLAAACTGCHSGASPADMPPLAGRPDVAERLREFKSGQRSATVMQQLARGYTEPEIDQLGAWFAARKP